jgi:hypothetical protein
LEDAPSRLTENPSSKELVSELSLQATANHHEAMEDKMIAFRSHLCGLLEQHGHAQSKI